MSMDPCPDQDLVHAVLLPDLQQKYDDLYEKKTEFTEQQARSMDLAGLPILINHDEGLGQVGQTIAYAVRDRSEKSNARAEVLFALTDPSTVDSAPLRTRLRFQQNALMNGAHRDVSLAHSYDVALAAGSVSAAAATDTIGGTANESQCIIRKNPFEISTCDEGKRTGSHVLAYLPAAKTLHAATEGAVRDFCRIHGFIEPPAGISAQSTEWRQHIERLASEIAEKRRLLFRPDVAGVHRASSSASNPVPWHFLNPDNVGLLDQREIARFFETLVPHIGEAPPLAALDPLPATEPAPAAAAAVLPETAAPAGGSMAIDAQPPSELEYP